MMHVSGLSRRYQQHLALSQVSFELPVGSRTAILGPSGSGKTTLLRLLAGLDYPDAGEIKLDGRVISRPGWATPPHLRGMGMVFQNPALWPHMTVAENILFGLGRLESSLRKRRLENVLEQCQLTALSKRYPEQLSGGEAHRVALARALAPQPPILMLDEPLAHLDAESKKNLISMLLQTTAQVSILLYVSHDPLEAEALCTQLWKLRSGRLETSQSRDKSTELLP